MADYALTFGMEPNNPYLQQLVDEINKDNPGVAYIDKLRSGLGNKQAVFIKEDYHKKCQKYVVTNCLTKPESLNERDIERIFTQHKDGKIRRIFAAIVYSYPKWTPDHRVRIMKKIRSVIQDSVSGRQ